MYRPGIDDNVADFGCTFEEASDLFSILIRAPAANATWIIQYPTVEATRLGFKQIQNLNGTETAENIIRVTSLQAISPAPCLAPLVIEYLKQYFPDYPNYPNPPAIQVVVPAIVPEVIIFDPDF